MHIPNTERANKGKAEQPKTASAETFITHTIFGTSFMRSHHWENRQNTRLALPGPKTFPLWNKLEDIIYSDMSLAILTSGVQGTKKGWR